MILNNVDIKVATDYTAFTNTIQFQVAVPVAAADATTIYKDLAAGDWATTQTAITDAVKKSAPTQVQTLVTALLAAYNGTPASGTGTGTGTGTE